jgi:diacylglycerol kinase family enzyme
MRSVLLIWNPFAGSVSHRRKEVIAKALSADFKLEEIDTAYRNHAGELARDAVDRGFDAVFAFGGDGTINEAAQGLIGSEVALGMLPGGSTNVMARSLGVPTDPVEASAFLAGRLRSGTKRRIDVGRIEDRYFLFCAGMGLDAEVIKRMEDHPERKKKYGRWAFLSSALSAGMTEYRGQEPWITLTVDGGEPEHVVLAICQRARPLTYFGRFPVDACPEAHLDEGLDWIGFTKVNPAFVPKLIWGVFVSRGHVKWKSSRYHHDTSEAVLEASQPLPVQVDGDYIGHLTRAEVGLVPQALDLLV